MSTAQLSKYIRVIDAELARKEEWSRKRRQVHEDRHRLAQQSPTSASAAMGPGDSSSTSYSARAAELEEKFHVQQEQGAVGTSRGVSLPKRGEECDYARLGSFL
jgi:hypothetical protein